MKVLGIDTSSDVASVALVDDNKLVAEYTVNFKKTHSERLMPMINDLLCECCCEINNIDLFAVAIGPGSFTGLRIGIATAKGLAHATGRPVAPIGTLEALAFNLPFCEYPIIPIMDARRQQVYTATYIWDDDEFREKEPPRAISIEECLNDCETFPKIMFIGDGVPVYKDYIISRLGTRSKFAPAGSTLQRASSVASLAILQKDKWCSCDKVRPFYIRKSQAEREYEEKIKK